MSDHDIQERLRKAYELGYDQGLKDGRTEGVMEGMSRVLKGFRSTIEAIEKAAYPAEPERPATGGFRSADGKVVWAHNPNP